MLNKKVLLFLIAAFSMTQIRIVGFIGISELAMLICGPFVLASQMRNLRRDGLMPFLILAGLWALSALVTDLYRQTPMQSMIKGLASPIMIVCMTPCFYALLRKDIRLFKWAVIGFVVTVFLSTYLIQAGTSVGDAERMGVTAREAALGYKLNYMSQVSSVIRMFPMLMFLKYPLLAMVTTVGLAVFALLEGGRSGFLCLLISAGLMMLEAGNRQKMRRIARRGLFMGMLMIGMLYLAKEGYEFAARRGYMGEQELQKHQMQSESKIGLLSGRSQFVAVFYAVQDSPILGHGSWAVDYKGYGVRAMEWLGEYEEIDRYYRSGFVDLIPGHSHLMTAYVWHGLLGAVFWVYVLVIIWRTFSRNLGVVPELFGYLALTLPALTWAIFFSPFGGRVGFVFAMVVYLLIRKKAEEERRQRMWQLTTPVPVGSQQ